MNRQPPETNDEPNRSSRAPWSQQPQTQRTALEGIDSDLLAGSCEFLAVVSRHRGKSPSRSMRKGVALWCRGWPQSYQDIVHRVLDIDAVPLNPVPDAEARGAIVGLADRLRREDALDLFLLGDALPISEAYEERGGKPQFIELGRRSLGRHSRAAYMQLFSAVNKAALRANGDWLAFRALYREIARELVCEGTIGSQIRRSFLRAGGVNLDTLIGMVKRGKRVRIVDTGMQATFALASALWLTESAGVEPECVDIELLVAYPWLAQLFDGRLVSTNADLLVAVEEKAKDLQTRSLGQFDRAA